MLFKEIILILIVSYIFTNVTCQKNFISETGLFVFDVVDVIVVVVVVDDDDDDDV